jgi:amino acid adenylation domain-containing protein
MTTTPNRELSPAKRALLEQRLAGQVRPRAHDRLPVRVPRRPTGTPPPMSFAQERVWFMEQYAPGTAAYAIPIAVRLRGALDVAALGRAIDGLAARHEALRMTFPSTVDGRPEVRVAGTVHVPLTVVAPPAGWSGPVDDLLRAAAAKPFDLATGPLLRALLAAGGGEDHVLVLAGHHIIGDGWSSDILVRELLELYRADVAGRPAVLAELPIQYGDFARWQRAQLAGPDFDGHRRYWTEQLAGVPPLDLPTDRARPPTQRFDGAMHRFTLDPGLTAALTDLGRAHGATLFMTLLAGYQTLLARHCGQPDFAVGSPVAGRTRPEVESLVGMFVNMLALRVRVDDDPTFADLLTRTRRTVLDGLRYQEMPFDQVVAELGGQRDVARSPVFQTTFALHNFEMNHAGSAAPASTGTGLTGTWATLDLPATRFDLELQAVATPAGLDCAFTYSTALFEPATVGRLAERFEVLLRAAVAEPAVPVSRLPLLSPAERALVTKPGPVVEVPPGATLPALVEAQVARAPRAVAVSTVDARLSYVELNERANRVAHRLRASGVGPETLVGVCVERSLDLAVALLGVLKSGAAYLPLDPDYPAERLAYMVEDSAAPIVLTQRGLADLLPTAGVEVLLVDDPAPWAGSPDHNPEPLATPASPAYVIYTSGSTGRPKGVANTHAAICNRLDWMQRTYRLSDVDTVLQKTPASFDVSVWEFFWPLLAGARTVLARPGGQRDPAYLRDLIAVERVTVAHFVPSMLTAFLDEDGLAACRSLRLVLSGGEELPVDTARRFLATLPDCALYNQYGPAEAAIDVSAWRCDPATLASASTVPIGAPMQNVQLYVLDRWMAPVPAGVTGELYIGGVALARGYLRRPALTADRFVPDPFGPPGSRLYRTGDLARWNPAGALEFLGRADTQVKLRGQRIEPGEIEVRLRERPGVRDAVVVVREVQPGDRRLVAYVVPAPGATVDGSALRSALKSTLPDVMVPASVTTLEALPLMPNGKLDRAALPAPGSGAAAGYVAPGTPTEATIARVWAEVLGLDRVGVTDDFFDLGGHSMLATQVVARLRTALAGTGQPVSVMDLFAHRTVAGLAALAAGPARDTRRLLHELTPPVPAAQRIRSYVCLPYGGGSAIVYQPLADALPAGNSLYALAIPGHDAGLDEDPLPFDELARRTTEEVLETVAGPIVLYGHCGVGGALVVEVARRLEAAGRELDAVYVGAIFPFARTRGPVSRLLGWLDRRASNRHYATWLTSRGVAMDELDPDQAERIITNMRADSQRAEEYFTDLFRQRPRRLRAPVISVIGERDPATDYYEERYREWHFLTDTCAAVVLDEAGHFFLKYRASELAEIVTRTHAEVEAGRAATLPAQRRAGAGWWLHGVSHTAAPDEQGGAADSRVPGVRPTMRRFAAVAAGQLVSITGSALATWAVPVWIYLRTGSLAQFAFFAVSGLVPSLLVGPVAGAIVDRVNRRAVMMASGAVAGGCQLVLALLYAAGQLRAWHLYTAVACVASALVFQRLAFVAAVPQLVPKRFLGNANGLTQMSSGFANLLVPLIAAGLLATIGLGRILLLDVISYGFALGVLAVVRFPDLMGRQRREPLMTEVVGGLRYSWGNPALRRLLLFSAMINVFLGPALILVSPLVLSFGSLGDVGRVSFAEALGAFLGGLAFTIWGGPVRRRMLGLFVVTFVLAGTCLVTGLRPAVPVVAAGVFGTGLALALVQSIYVTIVQVKVPQRFHGRVFALNQMIAWSTLPFGFLVLAPLAVRAFGPLLVPGGALAGTVGQVIGIGPGRGIGLVYAAVALLIAGLTAAGLRRSWLGRFDADVPDAIPDDLVGLQTMRQRRGVPVDPTLG